MRSINKAFLIGNITRDPDLKQTEGGQHIATFGIATNRNWTTQNGEKKTLAEFHECTAFSSLAELCHQHLRKGKLVSIEGYLKTRSWNLTDGTKRFRTEIIVEDMIMLDKRTSSFDSPSSDSVTNQAREHKTNAFNSTVSFEKDPLLQDFRSI